MITQNDFDTLFTEINNEQREFNKKMKAEIAEIERQQVEIKDKIDDLHKVYKNVLQRKVEIIQKKTQGNNRFDDRKKNLREAFPDARGTKSELNAQTRHQSHYLRQKFYENLMEVFKDCPDIKHEGISVRFTVKGDECVFKCEVPKK